ncbi:spore coat protein [Staphylococcus epidermidis]|uniref:spore coat protein n=1 Tax=Staphylococcus epidermidis TaxID=1282 RepID=UPI0034DB75FB
MLKKNKDTFSDKREERISEYELLVKYNPQFINRKCQALEEQINAMYHLNISHMTCDEAMGIVFTSYPLEKLVICIVEKKEKLERYKNQSLERMNLLKSIVSTYPYHEQQEIMHYMRINGVYKPYKSIDKLCEDLYRNTNKVRLMRQRDHLKEQRKYFDEEVEKVRTTLQTQKEELVI